VHWATPQPQDYFFFLIQHCFFRTKNCLICYCLTLFLCTYWKFNCKLSKSPKIMFRNIGYSSTFIFLTKLDLELTGLIQSLPVVPQCFRTTCHSDFPSMLFWGFLRPSCFVLPSANSVIWMLCSQPGQLKPINLLNFSLHFSISLSFVLISGRYCEF
jgi:hypothetical protein